MIGFTGAQHTSEKNHTFFSPRRISPQGSQRLRFLSFLNWNCATSWWKSHSELSFQLQKLLSGGPLECSDSPLH